MRHLLKRGVPTLALIASALALVPVAPAFAVPIDASVSAGSGDVIQTQFHGGRRFYGGGRYGRGYGGYRHGYRHRGFGGGAAVGAGIAGLAAGAIIGGAIANSQQPAYAYGAPVVEEDAAPVYANPVDGDQTAYCQNRFKSYDVQSGTYLGYDGQRHPCP